jgi:hypothetical protein
MVSNLRASSHIDAKLVDKEVNAHLEIFLLVNDIAIISMAQKVLYLFIQGQISFLLHIFQTRFLNTCEK